MHSFLRNSLLALYAIRSTSAAIYLPKVGTAWQIVLETGDNGNIGDRNLPVEVYGIDLFANIQQGVTTIAELKKNGKKVMCYFSAGTYEDNRPDSAEMKKNPAELGAPLHDFPDELWLDIRTDHIFTIMKARVDLAKQSGCDGIDPDNMDGYEDDNEHGGGFTPPLLPSDAVTFLRNLASYAHSQDISIGLKNGADILPNLINDVDWVVNEQCVDKKDCNLFQQMIQAQKPVFHIEYRVVGSKNIPDHDSCYGLPGTDAVATNTTGFSTLIKQEQHQITDFFMDCSTVPRRRLRARSLTRSVFFPSSTSLPEPTSV